MAKVELYVIDGGQGQSWGGRWPFQTITALQKLFLMMIPTSGHHLQASGWPPVLQGSTTRDGGRGQSWRVGWPFQTKIALKKLFLMSVLTSGHHLQASGWPPVLQGSTTRDGRRGQSWRGSWHHSEPLTFLNKKFAQILFSKQPNNIFSTLIKILENILTWWTGSRGTKRTWWATRVVEWFKFPWWVLHYRGDKKHYIGPLICCQ